MRILTSTADLVADRICVFSLSGRFGTICSVSNLYAITSSWLLGGLFLGKDQIQGTELA